MHPDQPAGVPDRRGSPRYKLELSLLISILLPEETFQPYKLNAKTLDLSLGGMCLSTDEMTLDLYVKLLGRKRYIRVAFTNPLLNEQVKITGRIIGIDFHESEPSAEGNVSRLRLLFQNGATDNSKPYQEFIENVAAA